MVDGGNGETKDGDGGGGGGGGGGAGTASVRGGSAGRDNFIGGEGGTGGRSHFAGPEVDLQQQWLGGWHDDAYVSIKYTGYTSTEVSVTKKTSISGAQSNTLKIASDSVGVQT